MVIGEALGLAAARLKRAGNETARLDAEVLLAALLKKERLFLVLHRDDALTPETEAVFWAQIDRRAVGEPVSYIIGHREFMSLSFRVEPGVLIPRPDTETLVEAVINAYTDASSVSILDICTGSGAIAVSLAYYLPKARLTAWDISPLCVQTAQQNAEQNGVAERVRVEMRDALLSLEVGAGYDCIVSNPPYIPNDVIQTLAADVRDFEPHLALNGGADGLTFYRHLIQEAPKLLRPGGQLFFEVGHDQADAVVDLCRRRGCFDAIETHCDLAGVKRVVHAFYTKT